MPSLEELLTEYRPQLENSLPSAFIFAEEKVLCLEIYEPLVTYWLNSNVVDLVVAHSQETRHSSRIIHKVTVPEDILLKAGDLEDIQMTLRAARYIAETLTNIGFKGDNFVFKKSSDSSRYFIERT